MAEKDDRKRLAEVHATDLNESRVNEDFVTWLKTKGPTWLLIILAFVVAYITMIRWQDAEDRARDEAWLELVAAVHPASLEDVALRYAEIDGVADLARLSAADTLLIELRNGRTLDDTGQEWTTLTPELRATHVATARRLYAAIVADDDGSPARMLATVAALNGLAALDETEGDVDQARSRYEQIVSRAEQWMPPLAEQAKRRAASLDGLSEPLQLATPPAIPEAASVIDQESLPVLLSVPPSGLPTSPPPAPSPSQENGEKVSPAASGEPADTP
ncbi:MAG: hypothetical protein MK077_03490 [Phycisphaerales bacterium]|nr:hypothetical protein [Phycisphaerales bacterium]